jgi:hypothetical protein
MIMCPIGARYSPVSQWYVRRAQRGQEHQLKKKSFHHAIPENFSLRIGGKQQ